MKTYRVTAPMGVALAAGTILALDKALAQRFADRLEPGDKGTFVLKQRTEFKAGLVIGIEGNVPKALLEELEDQKATPRKKGGAGDSHLRQDGPTVAEFVEAGFQAKNYPPVGYASKSTKEEVDAAIAAQEKA